MSADDRSPPQAPPPQCVLVVEDEVLVRLVIAEYLRECGFKVHEASNADEAVIVLEKPDISVDVVFSDIAMPGSMDGFGLSQWIRQHRPELGIILAGTPARRASCRHLA
jgi:CheY-like chemotaxis protein